MKLTDMKCRKAKPRERPYNLTDGQGLFLSVKPNGSKLWRCDYTFNDMRRTANFGPYPQTTLAQARDKRDDLKQKVQAGIDPSAKPEDTRPTFEMVAREWFKTRLPRWKTSYSTRIWSRIEDDVLPTLGAKPIADIGPKAVLAVLRAIESRDANYTAHRLHQMVRSIFAFAIANEFITLNPAASLGVVLKPTPRSSPRAALTEKELPNFFVRLANTSMEDQTRLALKLVVHTFVRTNEIRFAKWAELEGSIWRVPAERMKRGNEFLVPLSRQAKALFAALKPLAGDSEWVLPGPRTGKPISENTLLYGGIYRAGLRSRATIHGFRATASTILNESGLFRPDVIEHQLSHAPDDKIRAAYNRGVYWKERVDMMQWYSDLLDKHEKAGLAGDLSDLLG